MTLKITKCNAIIMRSFCAKKFCVWCKRIISLHFGNPINYHLPDLLNNIPFIGKRT